MPEDEAVKTMGLFEGASESQKISKSSLKNWVVRDHVVVLICLALVVRSHMR